MRAMQIDAPAIVVAVLPHGEHGAVVRLLTREHGLVAGYVRGGRSRRLRPVLGIGNVVAASLRARAETQLAALTVELVASRAAVAFEAAGGAALEWLGALVATALPEGQAHPGVFDALDTLLEVMERGPGWAAALARFELLLLAELGFGLDLSACAATGARDDLAYVSPRSSTAVSRAAGAPYAGKLLALPALLVDPAAIAPADDVTAALTTTAFFLRRDLIPNARIWPARERLAALLARG